MDRSSYRVSMLLETLVLSSLVATLPLTQRYSPSLGWAGFAVWVWAIYFTFPGTYSTSSHHAGGPVFSCLKTISPTLFCFIEASLSPSPDDEIPCVDKLLLKTPI